jgi:aspartate/methionine/tyrosine aminotransferase
MRKIPASGINLFQLIYILIREYEEKHGKKVLNLSLGNPDLSPPPEVLELKGKYAGLNEYEMHTYGEDKDVRGVCAKMAKVFLGLDLAQDTHLRGVTIPGIKTATALLPLACGLHRDALSKRPDFKFVTHLPAYDVAGTWGESYLGASRIVWPLRADQGMRLNLETLKGVLKAQSCEQPAFIHVIRPGNPASVGATRTEWLELIDFCIERKIRLVNDAAYTTVQNGAHTPLAQVAREFKELEWIELISVSKSFSDPGARFGVAVGSQDFVDDLTLIKGNTESGPVPHIAAAYAELFENEVLCKRLLSELAATYRARLDYLVPTLKKAGLKPACETDSGFFTLWRAPKRAFGVETLTAEAFNRTVIEHSGIVGVHFTGPAPEKEPLIRYAACTDVLTAEFKTRFEASLAQAAFQY